MILSRYNIIRQFETGHKTLLNSVENISLARWSSG